MIGTGTFGCGSTIVEGEEFIAENITFENSSPEVIMCLPGYPFLLVSLSFNISNVLKCSLTCN